MILIVVCRTGVRDRTSTQEPRGRLLNPRVFHDKRMDRGNDHLFGNAGQLRFLDAHNQITGPLHQRIPASQRYVSGNNRHRTRWDRQSVDNLLPAAAQLGSHLSGNYLKQTGIAQSPRYGGSLIGWSQHHDSIQSCPKRRTTGRSFPVSYQVSNHNIAQAMANKTESGRTWKMLDHRVQRFRMVGNRGS